MPADRRAAAGLALAALLLGAALLAPALAGAGPATLPRELPLLLLVLAGPAAVRTPLRVAATAALAALLALALLDLATGAALGRRFNPALDLPLVAAGWRLAAGALGTVSALAAAACLAAAAAGGIAALWWATARVPAHRGRWPLLALAPALALALSDPAAGRYAAHHLRDAWHARADLARFRAEAASDDRAALPPAGIMPALRGRDVFLVFVESYGRAAIEAPGHGPTVTAALARGEATLAASGLAARSAWLTAPVAGGQSWLARASAVSGLTVDGEARYRALLASPRRTLHHLARAAGWTTAVVAPAITLPWPEAGWFGYERILAARDLGYRGKPFNWVTMPDQFTLAATERLLLGPAPRPPVFAEIALISSHAPWTPIPPMLPWDALADGRAFDRFADAGDPPEVVWQDPERVRAQYRAAVAYALDAVAGFAARRAGTGALLVVLGDHQPAAFVSGDPEGRDVPVHLVGPPALVDRLPGWTPGLVPGATAPTLPMAALRDLLLDAYAGVPPPEARANAPAQPLPTGSGH